MTGADLANRKRTTSALERAARFCCYRKFCRSSPARENLIAGYGAGGRVNRRKRAGAAGGLKRTGGGAAYRHRSNF
jgi:hypothetical protein